MNQTIIIILVAIVIILLLSKKENNKENFYFRSPPLAYSHEACTRMCDNTDGCQSSWFDPNTRACWMNSYYRYGDIYYPYVNNTYTWTPSRFRFGKYFGRNAGYRPKIKTQTRKSE